MYKIAELEVRIWPFAGDQYEVAMTSRRAGSDSEDPAFGRATIDPDQLAGNGDAAAYGAALGQALFADPALGDAFHTARDQAKAADARLRIRLSIDPAIPKLHAVRWETLRDAAGNQLLNGPDIWFSRYLSSNNWDPVHSRPALALKALVVIASPVELGKNPNGPAPIPVAAEIERANAALVPNLTNPPVVLARVDGADGKPTLIGMVDRLNRDGFDILYLVCHGAMLQKQPQLLLEKDDGTRSLVPAADVVDAISRLENKPRLVVLASCESAGTGREEDALAAFGPLLAKAGVPAVLAMQGKLSLETAQIFMPLFFAELMKDGQIDRAMAAARGRTVTARCLDYWMPVLFLRLLSGSLWYQLGFAGDSDGPECWPSILKVLQKEECTPILGPGLNEDIAGSLRQIARDLAGKYGFPLAPWSREDLPSVMQFLAINQSIKDKNDGFPRDELRTAIQERVLAALQQYGPLPPGLDSNNVDALLRQLGKVLRGDSRRMDPHAVLAAKPFSIYITVNPDETMEEALADARRSPCSDYARWSPEVAKRDKPADKEPRRFPVLADLGPDYRPSFDKPLVYHLFGKLSVPASLVITEDDYFDYLLRIDSKSFAGRLMPGAVATALTAHSLLFIGFRLEDWSFRVLLHSISSKEGSRARGVGDVRHPCVGAQLLPDRDGILDPTRARRYFHKYLLTANISIFWGGVRDFIQELDRQIPGKSAAAAAS